MTTLACVFLALVSGAGGTRLNLSPGHFSWTAVAYHQGNLWVGDDAELWRYGADGSGHKRLLPGESYVMEIFPRGGTVDIWSVREIVRLNGESLATMVAFERRPRQVVALGDGYVALDYNDELSYYGTRGTRTVIPLETCDSSGDAIQACESLEPLDARGGELFAISADRLVWVKDCPYEILTFGLDGRVDVLWSEPESPLAREPSTPAEGSPKRMSKAKKLHAHDGYIFVDRLVNKWVEVDGYAEPAIAPSSFVDVIAVADGTYVKRVHLDGDIWGSLVGLRDADTWVIYTGDFDPELTSPTVDDIRWRLRFVPWRDLPEWVPAEGSIDVGAPDQTSVGKRAEPPS